MENVAINLELLWNSFWNWLDQTLGEWASEHLADIIAILAFAWLLRKFGTRIVMRFIVTASSRRDAYPTEGDRKKRIKTLNSLIDALFRFGSWTLAILFIIAELKPEYAGVLFASAGIIGVAIGFGTQSLIKDFISGVFIIMENQYRVGDTVEINNITGVVEAITIRTTIIRGIDGSVYHIPNGSITVTKNNTMDYGKMSDLIILGEGTNIDEFEKMVNKIGQDLAKDPLFAEKITDPPRFDKVQGINDKGDIIVRITSKTKPSTQAKLKSEFYIRLKKVAEKQKIKIYS